MTISKIDLFERTENLCKAKNNILYSEGVIDGVKLMKEIEDENSSHTISPWVSVKDELPNLNQRVIVCDGEGYIDFATYCMSDLHFPIDKPWFLNEHESKPISIDALYWMESPTSPL